MKYIIALLMLGLSLFGTALYLPMESVPEQLREPVRALRGKLLATRQEILPPAAPAPAPVAQTRPRQTSRRAPARSGGLGEAALPTPGKAGSPSHPTAPIPPARSGGLGKAALPTTGRAGSPSHPPAPAPAQAPRTAQPPTPQPPARSAILTGPAKAGAASAVAAPKNPYTAEINRLRDLAKSKIAEMRRCENIMKRGGSGETQAYQTFQKIRGELPALKRRLDDLTAKSQAWRRAHGIPEKSK